MELFLELVFTVAISLFFSFLLAKFLSGSSSFRSAYTDDLVSGERKFQAKLKRKGFECERRTGFVKKVVKVADLGESRQEKLVPEEILKDGCGSCDDVKIDENKVLREVEVEIVEEIDDGVCECEENLAVGSVESEKIANFETDLTKDDVLESEKDLTKDEILESEKALTKDEVLKGENLTEEADDGRGCLSECEEIVVNKIGENEKITEIETEFNKHEDGVAKSGETEILKGESDNEIIEADQDGVKEVLFDEEDDWEGIETTELERLFGVAVAFVGNKSNADRISRLGSDVKLQLYGLHKIATEGPCHEPQPMALKVSARANWNAWKQLGDMDPEVAMEQYVTVLLRSIPGCNQDEVSGDSKHIFVDADACRKLASDLNTWKKNQLAAVDERIKDELIPCHEGLDVNGSSVESP
ncbi:acyl-CoA-binding domain-containing protein 3-like isoform X1 [Pistacia vera]|uniref:acyl-CoA-binding domain-containing protein 3-like isoform X1 n=1 Tax=Pistacia vera TaxID=55513 RepID=UPI0012632E8E|nr:acyl-CoA-binding domain-containing protein 3-like isoform X1 [Pistacia vera]